MTDSMLGKVAIVTGAASGIGRATAIACAREGAKAVVADVTRKGGEDTVDLIRCQCGEAIFVKTDVSDEREVNELIATTLATYGRLDYAFNNAGIEGEMAPAAEYPADIWERVLAI